MGAGEHGERHPDCISKAGVRDFGIHIASPA
jgi:hypothetical protein